MSTTPTTHRSSPARHCLHSQVQPWRLTTQTSRDAGGLKRMRLCASKCAGTCYPLPKASPAVVYPSAPGSSSREAHSQPYLSLHLFHNPASAGMSTASCLMFVASQAVSLQQCLLCCGTNPALLYCCCCSHFHVIPSGLCPFTGRKTGA